MDRALQVQRDMIGLNDQNKAKYDKIYFDKENYTEQREPHFGRNISYPNEIKTAVNASNYLFLYHTM